MHKIFSRCHFVNALTLFCGVGALYYAFFKKRERRGRKRQKLPQAILTGRYAHEAKEAINLSLDAGQNMQRGDTAGLETKFNSIDFATVTDRANEQLIFDRLRQAFPAYEFIGEESSAEKNETPALTDAPTWIVDPVDGTTNFVHSFPLCCVSIGLCIGKKPVLGVVYCPATEELFVAAHGEGAFLNGAPIRVSAAKTLSEAIVLTEFGYSREAADVDNWLVACRHVILKGAHGVRALGSGVMDLCYLACGRLDAAYAGVSGEGWKPWDYCAGSVILAEAGAYMCQCDGTPFDLYGSSVVAASCEALADELVSTLDQAADTQFILVLRKRSK
jgi:inositol-phosphate phosphatase / L-galactose 1-phosphate phosphatase